tara:strand:- start:420 stop:1397 length:978 start_codon:yes stop_codon:yes gene_type:complete
MRRQEAIEDQALDWLLRRGGPDWSAEEQAELDAWLEESMAHKAAFWRADHGWRQADRIRSLGFDNDDRTDDQPTRRRWLPAAIAASLVAAVGIGTFALAPQFTDEPVPVVQQAKFDTPVGGHRTIPLEDGSTVELNTQTVIRTAVDETRRDVWLDGGEAFFEVAHRDGEPFVVHAGRKTITVLGTKFSVRRDEDGRVTVNVLEGRVRVDDAEAIQDRGAIITAGDIAMSRGTSTLITRQADKKVDAALAWREGLLTFDQAPLAQVVAEFNRYNGSRLVVTDAEAARIPIGGSFQASSADSFVRLLHDAYGLRIERDDNMVRISSP